jgi:hypothetical protein
VTITSAAAELNHEGILDCESLTTGILERGDCFAASWSFGIRRRLDDGHTRGAWLSDIEIHLITTISDLAVKRDLGGLPQYIPTVRLVVIPRGEDIGGTVDDTIWVTSTTTCHRLRTVVTLTLSTNREWRELRFDRREETEPKD